MSYADFKAAVERDALCREACAGLTAEQVAAIQRLVACFTAPDSLDEGRCEEHRREMDRLEAIFPRRPS